MMISARSIRSGFLAIALALAMCCLSPARAYVGCDGQVSPCPLPLSVPGYLLIGNTRTGSVVVNDGSRLFAEQVALAAGALSGNGTLSVYGPGSLLSISRPGGGSLDVGGQGTGYVEVYDGAALKLSDSTSAICPGSCGVYVTNGAGSTGVMWVRDAGSTFETPGRVYVGLASSDYGAGGFSEGRFFLTDGAQARTGTLTVGTSGAGIGPLPARAFGSVSINGASTEWTITNDGLSDGSLVRIGFDPVSPKFSSGEMFVAGGARLVLNGGGVSDRPFGISMAISRNAHGELNVFGPSVVEMGGGAGFIAVGDQGEGFLGIFGGGQVIGKDRSGLSSVTVGSIFGAGVRSQLWVAGGDGTGTQSRLHINGYNEATGNFLGVFRSAEANVFAGGRIDLDSSTHLITSPGALSSLVVGGDLTITGRDRSTGAASTVAVTGGLGLNPYAAFDRGSKVLISDGGQLLMQGNFVSTVASPGAGERLVLDIGNVVDRLSDLPAATVTVTGAGSLLALGGAADNVIRVAGSRNAIGALNISADGRVEAKEMQIGVAPESLGVLAMSGGTLVLSGAASSGPGAGLGAALHVGSSMGTGVVRMSEGAVLEVSSTAPGARLVVGGGLGDGGTGVVNVAGGSRLSILSPGAAILAGLSALSTGTIDVGVGAEIRTSDLIGVAHDGVVSTGGKGTLCVDGLAMASRIINGANGTICGYGVLLAPVTNYGVFSPGRSAGRISIDGAFASLGGRIILEIARRADGGFGIAGAAAEVGGSSFSVDEIVLSDFDLAAFADTEIAFSFLDTANPEEFDAAGLWNLATFFLESDGAGGVKPIDDADLERFGASVRFTARADRYEFSSFSFSPRGGAVFDGHIVNLPSSLWLLVLALGAATLRRRH